MFDLIITTFNRPVQVLYLVNQVKSCAEPKPESIIVVDASDQQNTDLILTDSVKYLHSSHKNQPYQRALGCSLATSDVVIFLDDDLIIVNDRLFLLLLGALSEYGVVGSSCGLNIIENLNELTDKKKVNRNNKFIDIVWTFTGAVTPQKGKIWYAGLIGERDETTTYVEHFSGGVMAFPRLLFPKLYDKRLFDFNEANLGRGEDKYISMGAIKFGLLKYIPDICLTHPPNESYYFKNLFSSSRRELFSRLLLSFRYTEIKQVSPFLAVSHFYWYALWRTLISFIYFMFHPYKRNWQIFKGRVLGLTDTIKFNLKDKNGFSGIDWSEELKHDLKAYEQSNIRARKD